MAGLVPAIHAVPHGHAGPHGHAVQQGALLAGMGAA